MHLKFSTLNFIYENHPEEDGEVIGAVLKTRAGVKPVYVSPGHLITLNEAADVVLASATRFRLPEPVRQAHMLAGA